MTYQDSVVEQMESQLGDRVVAASMTKAEPVKSNKALILCIARGKSYDAEMARQPILVRAIKTEMADPKCIVRVELIETHEFPERCPDIRSKTSSPQRRMMNPNAGREEKTRKMARAKIINLPHLPVKFPCKLKVSDLIIACNSV